MHLTHGQPFNRHPMILFDLVGLTLRYPGNTDAQGLMEESHAETSSIPAKVSDFFSARLIEIKWPARQWIKKPAFFL